MKLKKLTIHNIASIEHAVIDFEHGPLAEDSRFLICGPTGSGKTTILDAICLVLYGTTPRLSGAKSEGFADNEEKYGGKSEVKIDDTRMLMRRGSLNAYVELVFTDKDDKILKASWECSRAHNKLEGSIKDPVWKIADYSDNVISCKKKEIKPFIEECVGLTFEQFCRTTMLAQGDFTRFLKSEEGKKSEILEKLTGTDIYSEISRRIHDIKVEKDNVCTQIQNKMNGVRILSPDELDEIKKKQTELTDALGQLSSEEQKFTAIKSWIEQRNQLERQYEQICKDYEDQHKLMETDEFLRDSQLMEDWQRTAAQREEWNRRSGAARLIAMHKEKDEKLRTEYIRLSEGLLSFQNKEKTCKDKKKEIADFIDSEEPKAESYRQINLIQSLVDQHIQILLQIKKSEKSVSLREDEIKSLQESEKQQTEIIRKLKLQVESKSEALDAVSHELEKINYNELLLQQKEKIEELDSLKDYQTIVESHARCRETLLQKEKELKDIRNNITAYGEDVKRAEINEKSIEESVASQQQIYEIQEKSCKDIIRQYRSQLKVGDTCPLCGQKITELISDEHFISVLQPVKEQLEKLQKKLSDAGKLLSDRRAVLSQAINTEKMRLDEYSDAQAKEKDAVALKQSHAMFKEYHSSENPADEINRRKQSVSISMKEIDEKLKTAGSLQSKCSEIQKEKERLDTQLHKEENIFKEMENKCSLALNFVSSEKEKTETLTHTLSDTEVKLSQYINMESYAKDGVNYISAIKIAADKYQKSVERLQNADRYLQQMDSDLKHIGGLKNMIEAKHEEWQTINVKDSQEINDLPSCWMKLQADVMSNAEALRQAENTYSDADVNLRKYFKEENAAAESVVASLAVRPLAEINSIRCNLQNIRDKELSTKVKKNTIEHNLQTLNADRPDFEEGITYEKVISDLQNKKSEIYAVNQQLGQNKQILDDDTANNKRFAEIKKQLDEADNELKQWNQLHELFGSADGKKFRNIAQSYVLEQLLVNANQYLHQFSDRYEMECQPGSLTILLRDNEAGGVTRPTTTMSGGESFLLSLSLALGLSSLSRTSFSVDTLFIDEGFGTLDSTYLSCVIDALERLHQLGGKRIGIISHVESLKERLTTQIRLSRVNSTLSKVEVVSTI